MSTTMVGNLQNDLCDLQYSLHGKTELKFPNFRAVVYNCIFIVVAYFNSRLHSGLSDEVMIEILFIN